VIGQTIHDFDMRIGGFEQLFHQLNERVHA
jgi:hypothetical protein